MTTDDYVADALRRTSDTWLEKADLHNLFRECGVQFTDYEITRLRRDGSIVAEAVNEHGRYRYSRDSVLQFLESDAGKVACESHKYREPTPEPFDVAAALENAVPTTNSLLSREVW